MQYGKLIDGQLVRWVAPVVEQPVPVDGEEQATPDTVPEPIPQPQPPSDYLPIVDESFPPAGISQGVWVERDGQVIREWVRGPFEVSKFKLCMAFINAGKIAEFQAFINADANTTFLWNAATVLDSDNPMVLAALDQISGILPEGVTAQELLRGCRV